jgi:diguanylate cyclase (GGDEF)-like protein
MDAVQSDALTGARSVAALTPLLRTLVHEYRETQRPGMVVFADLNNLHELNLRFGHEVGNLALRHFVTVIRATVRGNDPVVRFGGDEFVIVLRETEDPAVVPRIMAALAQPVPMESLPPQHRPGQPVVITGSFGIVPLADFFEHHPELAKEADLGYCLALLRAEASQVMLRAKHASRGAGGLSVRSEAARFEAA